MLKLIHNQEMDCTDANLEAEPFPFVVVGEAVWPVIMRMACDFPRIRCEPISTLSEGDRGDGLA